MSDALSDEGNSDHGGGVMASRVFFHIGLPKTGTSFLQSILWANREKLRQSGLLLPGVERRDHLWASCVVRNDPDIELRPPLARSSWDRLVTEVLDWPGDAVISHEFFCSASTSQASAAIEDLAPGQVHVVITARDTLDLFVSSWQEAIKNKDTVSLDDYCNTTSEDPVVVWNWRALDLAQVLERWSATVPAERVHVIPLAGGSADPAELWHRFARLLGLSDNIDVSAGFRNPSMGVVEIETLRRINACLQGFDRPIDRGVWVRTYLGDERLAPRDGERFWPSPAQIAECRRRGARAVQLARQRGFDVVGRLEDLLTPEELPARRQVDSVNDSEVAAVAIDLVAGLLWDVRRLTHAERELSRSLAAPPPDPPPASPPDRTLRAVMRRLPVLKRPRITSQWFAHVVHRRLAVTLRQDG
jgi:hypothetical protein